MQSKIARLLFFLLAFLIVLQLFSKPKDAANLLDEVLLSSKSKITIGKEVTLEIENRSAQSIIIANACPKNPLLVESYRNGEWVAKESTLADMTLCNDLKDTTLEPEAKSQVSFANWNKDLFGEIGKYRVSYKAVLADKERTYTNEFEVTPPTFFQKMWNTTLYQPILNTLFFLIANVPGHNLGVAILLIPNQKALKSQRALQIVQPQLDALKLKYKENPQMLAQETMAIWKEHKVNPMGSCLPMLIQFPILIALFYVVKDGLSIDSQLLYESLKTFDIKSVNPMFLWFDLTKISSIVVPVVVGALQFVQIRLSFAKANPAPQSQAALMNKMMQYVLPVMVGVFSASVPAAVGLYWGVSTLFAIGQQVVVNRSK
jgi:YidC/Oxa1 family membrane protein insertase